MVIGTAGIFTTEFYTGPGEGVSGEEAQKDRYQSSCMPRQGERNQVRYHIREPSFPYQAVILTNNQIEVIMK